MMTVLGQNNNRQDCSGEGDGLMELRDILK